MTGAEGHVGYVPNNFKTLNESTFAFDKEQFDSFPDNVNVDGYRQTEKYFKHIEKELREDFEFIDDIAGPCKEYMSQYGDNIIFLHVRRGDYVSNPNHPLQTVEYYQRALEILPDLDVIVFSDDPDWCNAQEIFQPDRFSISESNTVDADLCLMSLCKYLSLIHI